MTVDGAFLERAYTSRFKDWDSRASVRTKPLRSFSAQGDAKLFFTPELVSVSAHPLIVERGPQIVHTVLAYHLFTHLDFTDALENEVVAPAAYALCRRQLDLHFPDAMLADARRIAVDEMHHALFASDLVRDIEKASGVDAPVLSRPSFLRALDAVQAGIDPDLRRIVLFFFAAVSETLITGTLAQTPQDERVAETVRDVLRDHAEDEARHHAYFAQALVMAWPRLDAAKQAVIGPLLPRFMEMFLTPDRLAIQEWLACLGLNAKEAECVIEESHPREHDLVRWRRDAAPTLHHMKRAGILDDARAYDAFVASGFID
jgi:hypothetical protein